MNSDNNEDKVGEARGKHGECNHSSCDGEHAPEEHDKHGRSCQQGFVGLRQAHRAVEAHHCDSHRDQREGN